ncbi:MAG: hypothetical protein KatS3mg084_0484 [Candidatus Dojkabacteria bacterium]|nr:MAG: hypothetical protein KatS3mg084_0484 [Candidatus Dojkabacteria bacterium]
MNQLKNTKGVNIRLSLASISTLQTRDISNTLNHSRISNTINTINTPNTSSTPGPSNTSTSSDITTYNTSNTPDTVSPSQTPKEKIEDNHNTKVLNLASLRSEKKVTNNKLPPDHSASSENQQNNEKEVNTKAEEIEQPSIKRAKLRHLNIKQIFILSFSVIVSVLSIFLIWSIYQSDKYHLGSWSEELTPEAKSSGIQESIYDISDDSIIIRTRSNVNAIESQTSIKYSVRLLNKTSAAVVYIIDKIEVLDIKIIVPLNLCNNNKTECEALQKQFRQEFEAAIEKQNQEYKGKILRISPNHGKLRFIITGEIEITLFKK